MKKLRLFLLLIILVFIVIFFNKYAFAKTIQKNVLILNSYHKEFQWTNKIEEGIFSQLKNTNSDYIYIKTEYMDSKEIEDDIYKEKLLDLYKYKYKDKKFDLIICTDNPAFEFLNKYRSEIFTNVPIVFCGINNFDSYDSRTFKNMTGITEHIDIEDNIKLILSLHPNVTGITAVVDNSHVGELLYDDLINAEKTNKFPFKINIIKEKYFKNVLSQIHELPSENALLFMASYLNNDDNSKIYVSKLIPQIMENKKIPIYGIHDGVLGFGAIGGKITSGFEQGKYAGKTALRILHGESIDSIPVKKSGETSYIFDYNRLKEFSIDMLKLPKNSSIINEPPSVYSLAKNQLKKIAGIIIFIFTIIIILLVINILNRKKLERNLKESKNQLKENFNFLRVLLDTIPNPIFCKNLDGKYTECNVHFEKFSGLKKQQIINHTALELNLVELPEAYHLEDAKLIKNGGSQLYESKVKLSDDINKDVIFSKAVITDVNNKTDGIVGVILDITERKKVEDKIKKISKIKEAMLMVNQSIIGIEDISELFDLILEKAIESIDGAEYGSILILNEEGTLTIAASKGYNKEQLKQFFIPLEDCFHWLKTGGTISHTIIINDVDKLDTFVTVESENKKENWNIKSCITSPIIINNNLYGMLNIDSDKVDVFSKDDLEIMEYMRNHIEISISKLNLYEEITHLSRYDNLTNIYNRKYFKDIACNKLEHVENFLVVIFDLNRLKFVNDNYGHLAGDEYIKTFVNHLKKIIGDSDVIARYGGDEFIGIFYENVENLSKKFETLMSYFKNHPLNFKENSVPCSFSYGIARFPFDSDNYDDLIRIADDRMYIYKQNIKKSEF